MLDVLHTNINRVQEQNGHGTIPTTHPFEHSGIRPLIAALWIRTDKVSTIKGGRGEGKGEIR